MFGARPFSIIYMIDRRLALLRTLAELGTVTATASALHLTPSAVSQQLRSLARDLGVELLHKDGRGVRLSPAAQVLLEHGATLWEQWEQTRAAMVRAADVDTGPLRLCGLSSVVAALFAPAAARLRTSHPELRVQILEDESADCFDLLLADAADIAVVLPTPDGPHVDDPRFEQRPLLDDPQDLLVPAGHALAHRSSVALSEAAGEPWIVKPVDNDTYPVLIAACTAAGFTPSIAHQAKEWFAVSALVAVGLGVCLMPRLAPIPPQHDVVRLPLHGSSAPARRFVAAVRRGSTTHPTVELGLATLQAAAHTHA